ncbi:hypothetical protein BGZ97_011362 [Linnemannia gamsii]|uniref:Uncharacterized protein n=1 Tax=Linnemannia gamsii TaxID=64522 RepID=A0A9P6R4B5_9FUNG|nr:hypothetical protein BGZ97_011362 [Linnemannia gamsii]
MGLVEDRLSIDLVAGALRQRDFQKAMMVTGGLAWCQPQVLQRTLDRYKKFMLLAKAESRQTDGSHTVSGPGLGAGQPGRHALVPTLDIDLAWHTHMLSPAHYRHFQLVHYGRVLNHDDTVQATSTMTKQDFVRTADLWQELYQERYSSQQAWKSRFVVTPQKVCAGVCFPPYGVYLVWKSWKSKRKAKKLNRENGNGSQKVKKNKEKKESKKHKLALKTKVSEEATVVEAEGAPPKNLHSGTMEKDPELQMEELAVAQEEEDLEPPAQGYDTKGKGKVENGYHHATNGDHDLTNGAGIGQIPSQQQQGVGVGDTTNRNLTPALGLDGRLSNWNGDTTGPDGYDAVFGSPASPATTRAP